MSQIAFYVFSGITLACALGVVLMRNVLHSALLLGVCLAGVAGLFASLGADFLFAGQIMIYVGGVAVLVLFVVLLSAGSAELHRRQTNDQWLAGLLICGVTFWGLWRFLAAFRSPANAPPMPTTAAIGRLFSGDLAVPFELISLILIVALIGAVLFSRPDAERERR